MVFLIALENGKSSFLLLALEKLTKKPVSKIVYQKTKLYSEKRFWWY